MRSVGLKMLKKKLGEYVRFASRGETVLVTDHDRVVAEIVPPRAGRSPYVADAVCRGFITPAAACNTQPPPRKPVARFADLMNELAGDRA
jgi:antitoxin (DNA-binding transcriptional repressor) of toxin-antitoxin stability system